ncbi:MAG: SMI1/KNR4 family protein, partial [Chryseotalea sp.]
MNLHERLAQVKINWEQLAEKDSKLEIFGAAQHAYKFFKPFVKDELEAGEKHFKIALPEQYKEYLQHVSNGGIGPYYGMYPLQHSLYPLGEKYLQEHPEHYSKTFPFTNNEVTKFRKEYSQDSSYCLTIPVNTGGYLFLAEYGCGGYYILILNGECKGQVWYLFTDVEPQDDSQIYALYPQFVNGTDKPIDFLTWIEDYIEYYLFDGNFIPNPEIPFTNPEQIKNLVITNKNINTLPDHLYQCENVEYLKINSCHLTQIDGRIKNFKKLKVLDLFFNDVEELPEELGRLVDLEEVYLKTNSLTQLPKSIGNLKKLKVLDVSFNSIHDLPESFSELKNLQNFYHSSLSEEVVAILQFKLPNLAQEKIARTVLSDQAALVNLLKKVSAKLPTNHTTIKCMSDYKQHMLG